MFEFLKRQKKQEDIPVLKPKELSTTKELTYPQQNPFNTFVEITREGGRLEAHLTDLGKEYFEKSSPQELRAYFDGIMCHNPTADFNIIGTGLVIKATEYLAFRIIAATIIMALTKPKAVNSNQ